MHNPEHKESPVIFDKEEMEETSDFIIDKTDHGVIYVQHKDHAFEYSLIWIHGLDEDGEKYLQMIKDGLFRFPFKVRVVIPIAPIRFTSKMDKEAHSWYDV